MRGVELLFLTESVGAQWELRPVLERGFQCFGSALRERRGTQEGGKSRRVERTA